MRCRRNALGKYRIRRSRTRLVLQRMPLTCSQVRNKMLPSEGTPTTPLMQRAHHRHSSSAGPSTLDTTVQVQCRGRKGEVMLSADGTVRFTPTEVCPVALSCISCVLRPLLDYHSSSLAYRQSFNFFKRAANPLAYEHWVGCDLPMISLSEL